MNQSASAANTPISKLVVGRAGFAGEVGRGGHFLSPAPLAVGMSPSGIPVIRPFESVRFPLSPFRKLLVFGPQGGRELLRPATKQHDESGQSDDAGQNGSGGHNTRCTMHQVGFASGRLQSCPIALAAIKQRRWSCNRRAALPVPQPTQSASIHGITRLLGYARDRLAGQRRCTIHHVDFPSNRFPSAGLTQPRVFGHHRGMHERSEMNGSNGGTLTDALPPKRARQHWPMLLYCSICGGIQPIFSMIGIHPMLRVALVFLWLVPVVVQQNRFMLRSVLSSLMVSRSEPALLVAARNALPKLPLTWLAWARALCRALVIHGRLGETFRVCPRESATSVEPLAVPFEPRPLDEGDPSFAALIPAWRDVDSGQRRWNRSFTLIGGWPLVLFFALLLFFVGLVVYLTGQRDDEMLLCLGIAVGSLLVGAAGAWSWRRQWLLVPGGLVLRKARWTGGAWRIHLYRRRSSVLLVQQMHRDQWMLCVADAEASDATRLTKTEAHVALASWLSPLPPPPAERLRDLR